VLVILGVSTKGDDRAARHAARQQTAADRGARPTGADAGIRHKRRGNVLKRSFSARSNEEKRR
jgi:hypothetical protein